MPCKPGFLKKIVQEKSRFQYKVYIRGDCWEWRGSRTQGGYGQFYTDDSYAPKYAHRYAYEMAHGPIPDGMHVDHLCRHRWCVRPSHLEIVTPHENALRGERATATHCLRGHEYTERDTVVRRNGFKRECRICINQRHRSRRRENAQI